MTKQNFVIKSTRSMSKELALKRALAHLRAVPAFKDGYILVDCPKVCDLFVVKEGLPRPCTGREWTYYFKTYLYPEIEKPKPILHKGRFILK